jgi:putative transcriptional regulator
MTDDLHIPELTEADFKRMIPAPVRRRIREGKIESGRDIVALRRFVGLSQKQFARALEISVHTLRNWEQGRRQPEGPAIALLKIAARHPKIVREAAGLKPPSTVATKR